MRTDGPLPPSRRVLLRVSVSLCVSVRVCVYAESFGNRVGVYGRKEADKIGQSLNS